MCVLIWFAMWVCYGLIYVSCSGLVCNLCVSCHRLLFVPCYVSLAMVCDVFCNALLCVPCHGLLSGFIMVCSVGLDMAFYVAGYMHLGMISYVHLAMAWHVPRPCLLCVSCHVLLYVFP